MPTYLYHCTNCEHELEKFQSIKAEPCKKCPNCHKNTLKRVLTGGAGIIFKGSGFYITDYKKKSSASKPPEKKTGDTSKSNTTKDKDSNKK
jgi:putative FmdB family regulatory protein